MLPADMDMRSVDAALERRPEPLKSVDASAARAGVFLGGVVDGDMAEAVEANVLVAAELVGVDGRAGENMLVDERVHRCLVAGRGNAGDQLAAALKHPDDGG